MAKFIYILLLLLAHWSVLSQTYNFDWVNAIDGSGDEKCFNIDYDTVNQSVYITGSHTSNLSGSYAGITNTSSQSNGFLMRFNTTGVYQWGVSSGGAGTCVYNNLKTDENGNIYVSGVFENSIIINGTTGTSISLTSTDDKDAFLAKFTSDGEILWIKHLSGNEDIGIRDIAVTTTGIVIVGDHEDQFSLVGSGATVNHNSLVDCFALKLDANGNFLWRRVLSGNQNERLTSVTSQGNTVFIAGIFNSSTTNYSSGFSAIGNDGFVLRLNTFNGNIEAEQFITGTNDDGIRSITSDNTGIYIGGFFDDNFSIASANGTSASNTSIFVSKLDLNLNPLWDSFGLASLNSPNTTVENICIDSTGNLFAIGHSRGNLAFNTGSINGSGSLETIIFSLKTSNGNYLFGEKVTGPPINYGYGIACNPFANELYCTGSLNNSIDFPPLPTLNASQTGGYVVKLACSTGSLAFEPVTNFCSSNPSEIVLLHSGNAPYTYTVFDGTTTYGINSFNASDTISFSATSDLTFVVSNFKADGCISPPPANLTLEAALPIGNNFINSNQLTCSNEVPNPLSGTTPTGGSSFDSFLWIESVDNINYTNATGTNNQPSYQPNALNSSRWYRRVVVNQGCGNDTSNFIKIEVFDPIDNNVISTSQTTVCLNSSALLTGTTPTGGGNTFNYQWQESADNSVWNNISGATFSNYTTPSLSSPIYYRRLAVTPVGCSQDSSYSNALYMQQYNLPVGSFNVSEDTLCTGDNLFLEITGAGNQFPLDVSYTLDGTNSTLSFPSSSFTFNLGNISTTSLLIDSLTDNNGCVSSFSDVFNIVVYDPVSTNMLTAPTDVCLNETYIVQGTSPTGGNGVYNYQWQESTDGVNWSSASGNSAVANYVNNGISDSLFYRRWVIAEEGCLEDSLLSTPIQIGFVQPPLLSFSLNDSICDGEEVNLVTNNSSALFPVSVFYTTPSVSDSFELVTNNQAVAFNPSSSFNLSLDSLIYNNCSAIIDTNIFINVFEIPTIDLGNDLLICGDSVEIFPSSSIGTGVLSSPSLTDLPSSDPYIVRTNNFETHALTWTVTNVICSVSDTVNLDFYKIPEIITPFSFYDIGIEDSTTVYVNSNYTTDYSWFIESGAATITDSDESKALIKNISSEEIDLVYEINNGVCPTITEKIKIVRADIKIPTGFSPNNDGSNDQFIIKGLNTEIYSLTIFDKYGRTVFESYQSTEGFSGLDKEGKELPEDTYYYILSFTFKGKQYDKQSFLLLKR